MFAIKRTVLPGLGFLAASLAAMTAPPAAAAECSCMCVDGVSYEVCTGIVTTQAITQQCTEALECPAVDAEPAPDDSASVDPPADTGDQDLDCRRRHVYRPDLGEYRPYKVCMPAERAEAHDRRVAKRAEMRERYEAMRSDRDGHTHRGRGPRESWH